MKQYNGHRSWNAWNISLWISNDEGLYLTAKDAIKRSKRRIGLATSLFLRDIGGTRTKTPDGGVFNATSVKLALMGLMED